MVIRVSNFWLLSSYPETMRVRSNRAFESGPPSAGTQRER